MAAPLVHLILGWCRPSQVPNRIVLGSVICSSMQVEKAPSVAPPSHRSDVRASSDVRAAHAN
eukprot:5589935-Amphidinium_carterae.1